MNIETYRPLVEQLKPLLKDPEFDELFSRFLKSEPKQTQFLIKMELKRLAEPCIRVIDCRPRAGDECKAVRAAGTITHYLDEPTRAVFEREMKVFGRYTMGVYEAVMQKEKALKSAPKENPAVAEAAKAQDNSNPDIATSSYSVPLVRLGNSIYRKGERLILSTKVKARLTDGRLINASISDFSVFGLKLRLPSQLHLASNMTMTIDLGFMRQATDHSEEQWQASYRLIAIHKQNAMYQWVRLQRIDKHPLLTERIERYFDRQRQRLTIDTDSAVESVQSRGLEDAAFRRLTGAPVLIGQTESGLKPVSTLRTEANANVFNYWRGTDGNLRLSDMLTTSRLRELSANAKKGRNTLLYSFSHLASGQLSYFVASEQELLQTGLKNLFYAVGAHRDSWRVFSLTIHALNAEDAERPLCVPEKVQKEIGPRVKQTLDLQTRKRLGKLKGVVLIYDITSQMGSHAYKSLHANPEQDANALKQFKLANHKVRLSEESFEFTHTRSETRYLYRTPVTAKLVERAATGTTINLSGKGLQIQLSKPIPVAEGDILHISMPKLQALDSKVHLTDIPYRVMAMNQSQTLLSLKINADMVHPSVVPFMKSLLKLNGHKLKQAAEQACLPEYISGLRNMLATTLPHPVLYVSRIDNRVRITHVASGNEDNGILPFLQQLHQQTGAADDSQVNLTPMMRGDRFNQLMLRPLRVLQEEQPGCYCECLLAASRDEENMITKVDCLYLMDNTDPELARSFVAAAQTKSDFFALRINLSRYGEPNFSSINNELHYISDYAAHKAQKLEQELYALMGVGEIVDITEEIMSRLGVEPITEQDLSEST